MYTIYYYKVGRRSFDRAGRAQQPLTNRTPNEPASKVYMCPRIFQCVCCSWRFKCNQCCLLLSLSILPLPNFRIVHKGWIIVGPIGYRKSLGIFLAIFLLLNCTVIFNCIPFSICLVLVCCKMGDIFW